MKEFCLLFLVAGCFGQGQSQAGPNMPGGLNMPGGPNMPGGLNMPGGPNMTGGLNMPGGTNMPVGPTGMPPLSGGGGTGGTPSPTALPSPIGPQNVNRPCRRYDLHCIRYFFKDHSHCKQPLGKVPEPLYRAISNQFYPAYNLTVTNVNAFYTGFNYARVNDLYVNRETDKVVLTIEFRDLKKSSRDVFIRYHRRAREPIITYGYSTLTYPSLLLTVTIPQVNDLRLDKSDNFGYANTPPILDIDPKLGESSDSSVAVSFELLKNDLTTTATENLLTESSFFATVYIQKIICDFGLKLV